MKNSILLDEDGQGAGNEHSDAMRESVWGRTRPIIITAFGTAVGMLPIALERAIGLERLSPLAVVAIEGLILSTFLTLLYVPIFYTIFEDMVAWLARMRVKIGSGGKQQVEDSRVPEQD